MLDLVDELVLSVQDINIAITTEIKSKDSTSKLLLKSKLIDFFKCLQPECDFTTNEGDSFVSHQTAHLSAAEDRAVFCCYCLYGCTEPQELVDHMVKLHGKRKFQCSSCLYRAASHTHVQTHIKNVHQDSFVLSCPNSFPTDVCGVLSQDRKDYGRYISPYECILENCLYVTMSTEQYQSHVQLQHARKVCHICGEEQTSSAELVAHHLLHNIGEFQCPYCVFGAAQQEQILSHESLFHADLPLLIFHRNHALSRSANNGEARRSLKASRVEEPPTPVMKEIPAKGDSDTEGETPDTVMSMLLNPQMSIEVDDTRYEVGGETVKNVPPTPLGGASSAVATENSSTGSLMSNYMKYIDKLAAQQHPQSPVLDTSSLLNFQNSLNELECNICHSTTKDFNAMKRHLASHHHITAMFSCAYCPEAGQTQDKIKIHIKKKHPKQLIKIQKMYSPKAYYFNCPFCQFATDKKHNFRHHMCSELGGVCFMCFMCKANFSQRRLVVEHLKAVHGPETFDEYGEDKEALKNRVETILPILSKMLFPDKNKALVDEDDEACDITVFSTLHFTCPECSEKFRLPLEMGQHMKLHHIYLITQRLASEEEGNLSMEEANQKAQDQVDELVEGQKHELVDKLIKVHNISLFTDNRPSSSSGMEDVKPLRTHRTSSLGDEVINLSDDDSVKSIKIKTEHVKPPKQTARKSMPASSANVTCGICDVSFHTMQEAKKHHEDNHEDQELLLLQRCASSPTKQAPPPSTKEEVPTFYGRPSELTNISNLYICLSDDEEEEGTEKKTKIIDFLETGKKKMQPKVIVPNVFHIL